METEECTNSGSDGSTPSRKPNLASLSRTSRHFVKNSDVSTTETEDGDQSDSGVFNSSKTTGSVSDADLTDDGNEERVGVFNYFQPQTDVKSAPVHSFGIERTFGHPVHRSYGYSRLKYMHAISSDEAFALSNSDEENEFEDHLVNMLIDPGEPILFPEAEGGYLSPATFPYEIPKDASLSPEILCPDAEPIFKTDSCDYHHGKQGIIRRHEHMNNLVYDEAFENDSVTDTDSPRSGGNDVYDTDLQQIVIETPQILPNPSPRGNPSVEIDEGTELKTFNVSSFNQHAHRAHTEQYDEAIEVASDDNDDIQNVHVHERLYGPHNSSGFTSMDAEDDEEYEQEFSDHHAQAHRALGERTTFVPRYGNGGTIELPVKDRDFYHTGQISGQGGMGRSMPRDVDSSVNFPLSLSSTPVRRSYGTISSSHDHRTSEGTYIKEDITTKEPPFGLPLNPSRVERSMGLLLDSRSGYGSKSSPPPSNMPVGEPIRSLEEGMGCVISNEEKDKTEQTNRKKKKRKKNKGEAETDDKEYDENGNPVEHVGTVRTTDNSTSKSVEHCTISPWPPSSFPGVLHRLDSYHAPYTGGKIGDLDEAPLSASSGQDNLREKLKKRKTQKATVTCRELIPGNRGDEDVDKLLDFITGNNNSNSKKSVKKKPMNSSVQENGLEGKVSKGKKSKLQPKLKGEKKSESSSEKGDDSSSKNSESGEEKGKISSDNGEISKVSDNVSEGSISSDLIKDVTATAAKLDNNKGIKHQIGDKMKGNENYSSIDEGPTNGTSEDVYTSSLIGDAYIFTDYDSVSAPVEQDFVTVATKKKKTRGTAQSSSNFTYRDNGSQHYNSYKESSSSWGDKYPSVGCTPNAQPLSTGDDRRVVRSSRPMTRSVTPPPSSYSSSSQMDGYNNSNRRSYFNKAHRDRAFSPSSILTQNKTEEDQDFPVINNHSNDFPSLPNATNSHDGRRNSTGNVPSEVTPEVDSDMESVKSLPLASSNQGDGASSPRGSATSGVISYARITAGPRGGGKTMSMSNSTSTASVNSVPSSTVSNSTQNQGNHSADVSKQQDEGYVTTDNAVDSGPSTTVSASSSKSEELSCLSSSGSSETKPETDALTSQSPDVKAELLTTAQQEPEIATGCDAKVGETAAEFNSISSVVNKVDERSCSSISNKTDKADVYSDKPVMIDDIVSEVATSSSKPGAPSGKRTTKSKSSVVFLDKKMNNSPQKMDISFGFDEVIDNQAEDSEMHIQFGDCVQGMQFGGPSVTYPAGEYVSTGPPASAQDICSVKGIITGMNGVVNTPDMIPYHQPVGIPVNLAQPPPSHAMIVVPSHAGPTSGQMMIPPPSVPPPSAQFIPIPPSGVPPPQIVTSVPPPVAVAPLGSPAVSLGSPVVFGTDAPPTVLGTDHMQEELFVAGEPAPPTDVSNEKDFPPLSSLISKNRQTTTSAVAVKEDALIVLQAQNKVAVINGAQFDSESSAAQQQQGVEVTVEKLKKFWPPRENDPNYDCGNFVVEQAVFYLKKEWDRVLSQQKKYPEKVLVCSGV